MPINLLSESCEWIENLPIIPSIVLETIILPVSKTGLLTSWPEMKTQERLSPMLIYLYYPPRNKKNITSFHAKHE